MKKEYFEIVVMILKLLLLIMSVVVVPYVQKYLKQNTTKEQREYALFWIKSKGAGELKKQYVIEWLEKNGVRLSDEQLSVLIDMVVAEYNKNGWNLLG